MTQSSAPRLQIFSSAQLIGFALAAAAFAVMFHNTFVYLYANWQREEYSHGFLIPVISALLIWQRRAQFERLTFTGSWWGVVILGLGLLVYFVGSLASITTIDAYAMVIVIGGGVLSVTGWPAFRLALGPLSLLFLMNPIPAFLFNNLSSMLQLISSQLGVGMIRLLGISVHLEGNVIDLGNYQLQVVEACSGLRYLFPLLTLGLIVVSLIRCALWVRTLLVLSTIPITVLMNSFRIGVIGILVDRYGIAQAEGFLHDFEGWIIFMACLALLILETWILLRLIGDRRPLRDIIVLEWPAKRAPGTAVEERKSGPQALVALALVVACVYPAAAVPNRLEMRPARSELLGFPMQMAEWTGRRGHIEALYLDELKLDDYVIADYARPGDAPVNLYIAYYASQRAGQSAHSPSSCLPGAGWRMSEFAVRDIANVNIDGQPLRVNRTVIAQGEARQLVYYWFQQRGRVDTNEYVVKWHLLWDSLWRQRSDGALVRFVTPLRGGEDVAAGDARLTAFAQQAAQRLTAYIPD
jgi:exosortase D (VPLPA-CTERM-specific)